MTSSISRYKTRTQIEALHAQRAAMEIGLSELILGADTVYAAQDEDWQEGVAGARHCAATEKLRLVLLTLRGLDLPGAGELG